MTPGAGLLPPAVDGGSANSGAARRELQREVAGAASDLFEPLSNFLGVRPNRDPLLASRTPEAAYAYPYGLFEEALDKDAHLSALIAQRKAAVLSWQRRIEPADGSAEAQACARFVEAALAAVGPNGGGLERDLWELLDAVPYGLAVSEIIWAEHELAFSPGSGACPCLLPRELRSRHPRRFVFGEDGRPRLLTQAEPERGEALPERKFLVFAPYGRHEDPYGLPALRSVWWLCYFKRQALRFWVMFAEKFGSPTTVLKHPLGATDREKAAYRRLIGSIQQETGLVVPEGVELALLEGQRSGSADTYRTLIELCNAEMSKALLGQTLTLEAGERGARSLGEVHLQVREDIVRQDAQALEGLLNGQLIPWLVELNLPPALRRAPRLRLVPPREQDMLLELEIDGYFRDSGLAQDAAALYSRYGRTPPPPQERQPEPAPPAAPAAARTGTAPGRRDRS